MADHIYKTIEITGSSKESIEDAVQAAIARSGETLHNLRWFEVAGIRGYLENGKIDHWQVTTKIGFTLDD